MGWPLPSGKEDGAAENSGGRGKCAIESQRCRPRHDLGIAGVQEFAGIKGTRGCNVVGVGLPLRRGRGAELP